VNTALEDRDAERRNEFSPAFQGRVDRTIKCPSRSDDWRSRFFRFHCVATRRANGKGPDPGLKRPG